MHRLYIAQKIAGDTVNITDVAQVHHLRDAMRVKAGEALALFDSEGNEYAGTITAINSEQITVSIQSRGGAATKRTQVTIACAIPKKTKMDDIIDALTQLGVDTVIPMETERVIVKLDEAKKGERLVRWRKIAQSAAEQSQRSNITAILPISTFESVLSCAAGYDLKLIPHLEGERRPLRDVLAASGPRQVLVLIGPEGDFSPREVALAKEAGFVPVSLGDSVLRVSVAAMAVAAYLRLALV